MFFLKFLSAEHFLTSRPDFWGEKQKDVGGVFRVARPSYRVVKKHIFFESLLGVISVETLADGCLVENGCLCVFKEYWGGFGRLFGLAAGKIIFFGQNLIFNILEPSRQKGPTSIG